MPPTDGKTLWVGSLGRVTESDVKHFFSRFGTVERVSLGTPPVGSDKFAFVTYSRAADAAAAMRELGGELVKGLSGGARPLRIELSRGGGGGGGGGAGGGRAGPPPLGASTKGRGDAARPRLTMVWVGNIDLEVTEDDIWDEFSEYGAVGSVKLEVAASGTSHFAVVGFEKEEDAEYAVQDLDRYRGLWISGGRPLNVQYSGGGRGGGAKAAAGAGVGAGAVRGSRGLPPGVKEVKGHLVMQSPPSPLLWVGNLHPEVSEGDLRQAFSRYGRVAWVLTEQRLDNCQYAFVAMGSKEEATRAVQALNGTYNAVLSIETNNLKLRYAVKREEYDRALTGAAESADDESQWPKTEVTPAELAAAQRHIWVGNLAAYPSETAFSRVFSKFGKIERIKMFDGKLFAFVDYFDTLPAARALKALNGKAVKVLSGTRPVAVEYHIPGRKPGPQQEGGQAPPSPAPAPAPAAAAAAAAKAKAQGGEAAPQPPPGFELPGTPRADAADGAAGAAVAAAVAAAMQGLPSKAAAARGASGQSTPDGAPFLPPGGHQHELPAQQPPAGEQHQAPPPPEALAPSKTEPDDEEQALLHLMGAGPPSHLPTPALQQDWPAVTEPNGPQPFPPQEWQQLPVGSHGAPARQIPGHAEPLPPAPYSARVPPTPYHQHPLQPQPGPGYPQQLVQQAQRSAPIPPPPPLQPPPPSPLCCACCGASEATHGVALRNCTGCNVIRYCGPDCQLQDWNAGHHADCALLAGLATALQGQPMLAQAVRASLDRPLGRETQLLRRALASLALQGEAGAPAGS